MVRFWFHRNNSAFSQLDRVQFIVMGVNDPLRAPILRVDVFRSEWGSVPDVQQWARYFPEAHLLLGFANAQPSVGRNVPVSSGRASRPSSPSEGTIIYRDRPTTDDATNSLQTPQRQSSTSSEDSSPEVERLGLPSFPRRSNRLRITESGDVLEVETIRVAP